MNTSTALALSQSLHWAMRDQVARHTGTEADRFLADWDDCSVYSERSNNILPVTRFASALTENAVDSTNSLAGLIISNVARLDWRQTYGVSDFGEQFLERYGWVEIIGQRGVFASDRIAAGFLLLGPDLEYPFHSHEAEELYLPLSGTAEWAKGDGGWQMQAPGTLIYHPSRLPHAMKTGTQPLLALYVWRAGNLTQKSVILRG